MSKQLSGPPDQPATAGRVRVPSQMRLSGPLPELTPPARAGDQRGKLITGAVAVLMVLAVVYLVFGRSPKETPTAAATTPDTISSAAPKLTAPVPSSGVAMPKGDLPAWRQTFAEDFTSSLTSSWWLYDGQPGGDPIGWFDPHHVSTRDGVLVIAGYRQSTPNGPLWATGGINNSKVFSQTYGRFDIRFRMDKGRGIAYATLLWPTSDSWPPEIDIAEDNGKDRAMTSATLHYGSNDVHIHRETKGDFTVWHTASVEWSPGRLVYRLDGKVWTTINSSGVPDIPMSIGIQTQAWRCGSWFSCTDSTTPSVVNLYVDWVVAYQAA